VLLFHEQQAHERIDAMARTIIEDVELALAGFAELEAALQHVKGTG
jgi:hypothetical protein